MVLKLQVVLMLMGTVIGFAAGKQSLFLLCRHNSSYMDSLLMVASDPSHQVINIRLCRGDSDLETRLDFSNKTTVSFSGERGSTLRCTGPSTGLHFNSVGSVELRNVTLLNCGSMATDIALLTFSCSILIQNSVQWLKMWSLVR